MKLKILVPLFPFKLSECVCVCHSHFVNILKNSSLKTKVIPGIGLSCLQFEETDTGKVGNSLSLTVSGPGLGEC